MLKTLDDVDVKGKRVIVRGDLNVPMIDGEVIDSTRIDRLLPTLGALRAKGAKIIVASHFGRPKGERIAEMSLGPVAATLASALGTDVAFVEDCIGPAAEARSNALSGGDVILLENLRYHAGEEKNDPDFAAALARLGDLYVNDAFSCAHRAHASTEGIAKLLPSVAGRNMQAELEALESALGTPEHPVAAIVGGAKVSSKLSVLVNLVDKVDILVIGGGMANSFLYALGTDIGASLCEKDLAQTARDIMGRADEAGCEIILPGDAAVSTEFRAGAEMEIRPVAALPDDGMILDIGPESIAALCAKLESCKTLIWNGPMGAFEIPPFDRGTVAVAQKVARLTRSGNLVSIAGGGDTVAALGVAGVQEEFSYVSTAGGAFLEWMEGRELPGVMALQAR